MKDKAYLTREIIEKINKSAGISFKTVNKESFEKIQSKALLLNLVQYSDNDFLVINTYDSIKGEQLVVYSYKEIYLYRPNKVDRSTDKIYFEETDFTSIDLHNVNTSEIRYAVRMFKNCKAKSIDVSTMDTSNIMLMISMFNGVNLSTPLDLSNFKTSRLIGTDSMFRAAKIKELRLDNFNTSRVISMSSMFKDADIEYIDISNFQISTHTITDQMFDGCKAYINRGEDT